MVKQMCCCPVSEITIRKKSYTYGQRQINPGDLIQLFPNLLPPTIANL